VRLRQDEFKKRDLLLQLMGLDSSDGQSSGLAPFSFVMAGEPSSKVLTHWKRSISQKDEDVHQVAWQDPDESISLSATVESFKESPAIDYIVNLANHGKQDTSIFKDILPLDIFLDIGHAEPIKLYHAKGSSCEMDDFLPLETEIGQGEEIILEPYGGRSSNGVLPFVNLAWNGGGLIIAIGWSGQWTLKMKRGIEGLRIQAGMARTHFLLHSGEHARTPRILLLCWEGEDRFRGHNLLRQLILTHYSPRVGGKIALPPIAHSTAASIVQSGKPANEVNQLEAIENAAQVGIEAYWMDAYWYPQPWSENVGTWIPRKEDFPRGLRPLGDAAHGLGLKFVLWYEPERVRPGSKIHQEHPEFLLEAQGNKKGLLFNLGMPEARQYMTDLLSNDISQYGVDIYRQDFNIDPLPFWQAADTADRIGIMEISYINGLYEMWRELLRRHPGLEIDNCASGGRRIDLETCSLSFPLWRSDFPDSAHFEASKRKVVSIANQVHIAGLSQFVPLHAGPVSDHDFYSFYSAMSIGLIVYSDVCLDDFPQDLAAAGIEELKKLRPYMLGDFYPLTRITTDPAKWCAFQYHDPDRQAGFALYFRRVQCSSDTLNTRLCQLDPASQYRVEIGETYNDFQQIEVEGAALPSFPIRILSKPGCLLLKYEKISGKT